MNIIQSPHHLIEKGDASNQSYFFSQETFYEKSSSLVYTLSFFHFGVENGEEQHKHPIAWEVCGHFVRKFHGGGGSGGGGGGGGDGGDVSDGGWKASEWDPHFSSCSGQKTH